MGSIAKVEKLETLDSNILENTLVLEEVEPFPGYHGANLPSGYNPTAVYPIIKKKYSSIKIIRITQEIRKYFKHGFDGTAASICINNDVYNAIRLRNFGDLKILPELQRSYMYEGIKFLNKKSVKGDGVIELKKHFELEALGEGIYKDLEDPLMYYLRIPRHLSWQVFFEITTSIRHNLDNLNFDAALGSIYLKDIIDVVRIFAKDMELGDLSKIRQQYLDELRKY
ncbi:MAG: hypothetical protein AMS23_05460 [Bacteroides sp. SM1_62]|nr:MAG: hypothetical protein AMS26_00220 [Bacteroides sp. SM23_62]KPL24716.1 MAG: hypothetical protein AMS23_05460 [Bacteroides sp. SM1_62]